MHSHVDSILKASCHSKRCGGYTTTLLSHEVKKQMKEDLKMLKKKLHTIEEGCHFCKLSLLDTRKRVVLSNGFHVHLRCFKINQYKQKFDHK